MYLKKFIRIWRLKAKRNFTFLKLVVRANVHLKLKRLKSCLERWKQSWFDVKYKLLALSFGTLHLTKEQQHKKENSLHCMRLKYHERIQEQSLLKTAISQYSTTISNFCFFKWLVAFRTRKKHLFLTKIAIDFKTTLSAQKILMKFSIVFKKHMVFLNKAILVNNARLKKLHLLQWSKKTQQESKLRFVFLLNQKCVLETIWTKWNLQNDRIQNSKNYFLSRILNICFFKWIHNVSQLRWADLRYLELLKLQNLLLLKQKSKKRKENNVLQYSLNVWIKRCKKTKKLIQKQKKRQLPFVFGIWRKKALEIMVYRRKKMLAFFLSRAKYFEFGFKSWRMYFLYKQEKKLRVYESKIAFLITLTKKSIKLWKKQLLKQQKLNNLLLKFEKIKQTRQKHCCFEALKINLTLANEQKKLKELAEKRYQLRVNFLFFNCLKRVFEFRTCAVLIQTNQISFILRLWIKRLHKHKQNESRIQYFCLLKAIRLLQSKSTKKDEFNLIRVHSRFQRRRLWFKWRLKSSTRPPPRPLYLFK